MNNISHEGIVVEKGNGLAHIKIEQNEACSGCKISNKCSIAEKKEKTIAIKTDAKSIAIGDKVKVSISEKSGLRAVLLAFTIPTLLIILSICAGIMLKLPEGKNAIMTLFILFIYYIIIYIYKDKTTIDIRIEKKDR